jgi:hypothetical protein
LKGWWDVSLPLLAQPSDVQLRLPAGLAIDANRTIALLTDASAIVRKTAKQDFTPETTTEQITPIGYRLKLSQKPVNSISSVSIMLPGQDAPQPFPNWYWPGGQEVWLLYEGQVINLPTEIAYLMQWQTPPCYVEYNHGYSTTPDDVLAVVCSMVVRVLTAPSMGGVVSENVGEYGYRLSDTAAQGALALTQAEQDLLLSYRPKHKNVIELRW